MIHLIIASQFAGIPHLLGYFHYYHLILQVIGISVSQTELKGFTRNMWPSVKWVASSVDIVHGNQSPADPPRF
jgi:hypothetical protein